MGFMDMLWGLGFLGMAFGIIAMIISIVVFVFWILMIVDCVKRKFKNDTEKIVWLLVIIFAGIVGALIYYFIIKRNNKR